MAGHSLGVTGFGPKGLASKAQEEGWGNPTKMNRFQVGELDSDFFFWCVIHLDSLQFTQFTWSPFDDHSDQQYLNEFR